MSRERVVYDPDSTMGYRYRGRVIEVISRRRRIVKYRGVIDKHFMGWCQIDRSSKCATFADAEQWCNRWLDAKEGELDGHIVQHPESGDSGGSA